MEVVMAKTIDLRTYRPVNSSSFIGRQQGELVRKVLKIDEMDSNSEEVEIIVPSDTTSFNPSFFLGFLYESIAKLGLEKFRAKYKFKLETTNILLRQALLKNIEDGFRNATNSLHKKSGLNIF